MNAVAYYRVSTDDQSVDAQRDAVRAWAARANAVVVSEHVDHGISGGADVADRPGLIAALSELTPGAVLVVAKRDRLARDVVIAATVGAMAKKAGATIVSADGVSSDDTPEGQLLRTLVDAFAAYERALIRARTRAALAAKRARGEATSHAPWGYTIGPDKRLVEDDREQYVLALVSELRDAGMTLRDVVRELEAEGVVGRTGRPLTLTQVARMAARE